MPFPTKFSINVLTTKQLNILTRFLEIYTNKRSTTRYLKMDASFERKCTDISDEVSDVAEKINEVLKWLQQGIQRYKEHSSGNGRK